MHKPIFKSTALALVFLLFIFFNINGQTKYSQGPVLDSDKHNGFNRVIGGDDKSFYCFRIRHKGGPGVFYSVEKYNKATMQLEFSREVTLDEGEEGTFIESVEYSSGNVYVFRRSYDKSNSTMTLFFQTVSSNGEISKDLKEVTVVATDNYKYVDFEIFPNPSKTKLLVKAAYKANKKDSYKADLIIIDAINAKKQSVRQVANNLHINELPYSQFLFWNVANEEATEVIGMYFADNDDIFYCVNELSSDPSTGEKNRGRKLNIYTLKANEQKPRVLNLQFDGIYYVGDVEFSMTEDRYLVVGGFLSNVVEKKGVDLVKRGVFSFRVDPASNSINSKSVYFFENKMLEALQSTPAKAKYDNYKLDYILPNGNDTYYIGQMYRLETITVYNSYGPGGFVTHATRTFYYNYMDVIVAKLNSEGNFEWIVNTPFRSNLQMTYPHIYKQYIAYATDKNMYILCNEHAKNLERYEKPDFKPKDLKPAMYIHGSNFMCNAIDLKSANIARQVVFKNADFCFAPIREKNHRFVPPSDSEIFAPGKKNEIFIYTEDMGIDRFGKIEFE